MSCKMSSRKAERIVDHVESMVIHNKFKISWGRIRWYKTGMIGNLLLHRKHIFVLLYS